MTEIFIEDLTSHGEGVGTSEGLKIFVEGVLPFETVEAEVFSSKKNYAKAKLTKLLKASPDRVDPICPLFTTCGGCQLMHLSYEGQLAWKQKRVQDALLRIAGIDFPVEPTTPSPDQLGYRNKIHLHHGGFHKRGTHELIPIDRCYLHNPIGEQYLSQVKDANEAVIKTSLATGDVLLVIDGKANREYITEKLGDLYFRIGPNDFFQVNPKQALRLYEKAIACLNIDPSMRILDAYCGVGCLSLFAAQKAKEVLGIESGKNAVKRAKENAKLNGLTNVTFQCGKVEDRIGPLKTFDAMILNPPREGVDEKVLAAILQKPPKRLVYISCDPATLARDLKILQRGYSIKQIIPFDMFPQTVHVETLISLTTL